MRRWLQGNKKADLFGVGFFWKFGPAEGSGGWGGVFFVGLGHHEAEADFAALGGGAGFALEALLGGFVAAETADFFENAFHFELGLEAFEGAVDGLSFADLDFGHTFGGAG